MGNLKTRRSRLRTSLDVGREATNYSSCNLKGENTLGCDKNTKQNYKALCFEYHITFQIFPSFILFSFGSKLAPTGHWIQLNLILKLIYYTVK